MTDTPEQFHARALAAADEQGRLAVPEQAMWEDLLPRQPEAQLGADLHAVANRLAARGGRQHAAH